MTIRNGPDTGFYFILFMVSAQCVLFPVVVAMLLAQIFPSISGVIYIIGMFITMIETMMFIGFIIIGEGVL